MIRALSGLALSNHATDVTGLARSYGLWSGIRTNHVVSSSGSFFDKSGSSRGLSTPEDLELLIALRKQADLVIVDAATARNENYRKLSNTHLAIVSASGNFGSIPATTASAGVTLFSPASSYRQESQLDHIEIDPASPFDALMRWAKKRQLSSLLLEAGPTLTRLCFRTAGVAQSAITITPRVSPQSLTPDLNPFKTDSRLISAAESSDATFSLWSY